MHQKAGSKRLLIEPLEARCLLSGAYPSGTELTSLIETPSWQDVGGPVVADAPLPLTGANHLGAGQTAASDRASATTIEFTAIPYYGRKDQSLRGKVTGVVAS